MLCSHFVIAEDTLCCHNIVIVAGLFASILQNLFFFVASCGRMVLQEHSCEGCCGRRFVALQIICHRPRGR